MFIKELSGVKVYDSLDVLVMLYSGEELKRKVKEFIQETGISFSKRRLREHGLI